MSLNLDFKVQKEQKVRKIEDSLQNYLPKQKGYQKIIMEAMGYSLLAGDNIVRLICDAKNSSDPENVSCGTG